MTFGSSLLAAIPGLRHAFFTREGGVSSGIYQGLNGGLGSSDDPTHVAENRLRPVPTRPRPGRHPLPQLLLGVGEVLQPAGPLDLPGVIKPGLVPVGIALHARRIGYAQLPGDEVDHHSRHSQRVDARPDGSRSIPYRNDNGAWLNAAEDHVPGSGSALATPARPPGWTLR